MACSRSVAWIYLAVRPNICQGQQHRQGICPQVVYLGRRFPKVRLYYNMHALAPMVHILEYAMTKGKLLNDIMSNEVTDQSQWHLSACR